MNTQDENGAEPLQIKEIPSTLRRRVPLTPEQNKEFGEELRKARGTWYALWYRSLKLSEEYIHCCRNEGKGRLKDLYRDFGDVVDMRFEQWWQRIGRYLFAERRAIPTVNVYTHKRDLEEITNMRDKLLIEVPLNIRKATVVRKINLILKAAYAERETVIPREQSTAKRKLMKSKLRRETVEKMLDLYQLRLRKPRLTLWQLGEEAGIELDLNRWSPEVLTKQQERIRMGISVSRTLKQARNLIWNATEGNFPSIKNLQL